MWLCHAMLIQHVMPSKTLTMSPFLLAMAHISSLSNTLVSLKEKCSPSFQVWISQHRRRSKIGRHRLPACISLGNPTHTAPGQTCGGGNTFGTWSCSTSHSLIDSTHVPAPVHVESIKGRRRSRTQTEEYLWLPSVDPSVSTPCPHTRFQHVE